MTAMIAEYQPPVGPEVPIMPSDPTGPEPGIDPTQPDFDPDMDRGVSLRIIAG